VAGGGEGALTASSFLTLIIVLRGVGDKLDRGPLDGGKSKPGRAWGLAIPVEKHTALKRETVEEESESSTGVFCTSPRGAGASGGSSTPKRGTMDYGPT